MSFPLSRPKSHSKNKIMWTVALFSVAGFTLLALALAIGVLGADRTVKDRRTLRSYEEHACATPVVGKLKKDWETVEATSPALTSGATAIVTADTCAAAISTLTRTLKLVLLPAARAALQLTGLPLLLTKPADHDVNPPVIAMAPRSGDLIRSTSDNTAPVVAPAGKDTANHEPTINPVTAAISNEETQPMKQAFFDGLQFYTIVNQVAFNTVKTAFECATAQALVSRAASRRTECDNAALCAIRERYPDIVCLSPQFQLRGISLKRPDSPLAMLLSEPEISSINYSQSSATPRPPLYPTTNVRVA